MAYGKLLVLVNAMIFVVAAGELPIVAKDLKPPVPIVAQESTVDETGGYKWSYESGDGSKAEEQGVLKDFGNDTKVEVAQGNFVYTDPADGKTYSVEYIADEKGYQPKGEHLPVAPPVPPLIQRSLDFLATAPPPKDEKRRK